MKLLKTLLLSALLMVLTTALALAEDALPQDIRKFFTTEKRNGYVIMSHCEIEDYYFVAAQNESGVNHLFGFKRADGGWVYWLRTDTALPQGGWLTMGNAQGSFRLCDNAVYELPTLFIGRLEPHAHEYVDMDVTYVLRSGTWTLEDCSFGAMSATCVTFTSSRVTYYDSELLSPLGSIRATVQRNIRYADLDNIPSDYYDAKARLTSAPSLPASAELQAESIKFTGGQRYEVYSAPSAYSYRSGNGKAAVSTNSWIQVFGVEDGWAMIQYSIDADTYRIGYITAEALPANAEVYGLNFRPIPAWTSRSVTLTDDPFYSQSSMTRLSEGAEVQWLATIGEWAYVEVSDGRLMRGFVPVSALETEAYDGK